MAGQAEIDAIPDACEFRVVIDLFGVEGDARQESEGFAEILELQGSQQGLAVLAQRPACREIVHAKKVTRRWPKAQPASLMNAI
jgi:hypothetical protein